MFLSMGVGLYTSRVVLNTLGVEDFGVYNVVGGVVTLFGFFNGAMSSATQRFLSFDIGKGDEDKLNKTFNATLNIHFLIGIVVLILAETIGLWFVNNKLNLPTERINAVNWVYQFSILTFLFGIIQVPYNALIVARERMNIYAYISIFETVAKLLVVYLLVVSDFDKLKLYSFLLFIVAFLVRVIEKEYCKKQFSESKYKFHYDKEYFKILLAYSGWNLFGNIAAIARGQGTNILLNLFFGTVLNAAYGISMQVQGTVQTFILNFQKAVNPQIIKQYAAGNNEQCLKLIYKSAKYSYFLMFVIICPILYSMDFVLELWLKNPPKYTSLFVTLCLINLLIDSISGPLMIGAQATGNIKWYQIIVGTLIFLNLPFSYFFLKIYNKPEFVFYISIVISLISFLFRVYFLKNCLNFSIVYFFKNVILKILLVTILSCIVFLFLNNNIYIEDQFILFIVKSSVIFLVFIVALYFLGIDKGERVFLNQFISTKILKL